eukprot:355098-Chlamydomonas_euryale.AAC.1
MQSINVLESVGARLRTLATHRFDSERAASQSSLTPAQRGALGKIARATPCLLLVEARGDAELSTRLRVEFGDRLERAGLAADPARLRATLQQSYGLQPGASGSPPLPTDVYRKAYLIAVAVCEGCRATALPLLPPDAGAPSPVSTALSYLQLAGSAPTDVPWMQVKQAWGARPTPPALPPMSVPTDVPWMQMKRVRGLPLPPFSRCRCR